MSELTLTLLRLGYLALLWLLVLSVVAVLRRDLFGTRITTRRSSRAAPAAAAAVPAAPPAPAAPVAPAPPREARAGRRELRSLVVTEGSLQGTSLTLGRVPILIGRSPECTLVLDDDYASGRHARIYQQDGAWFVEDLGSTNGTFLGRTRVQEPTRLDAGTSVRIGRTVLELRR